MPFISLTTNVQVTAEQQQLLLTKMSAAAATATGKSESYVMTQVESGKPMLFAGSDQPLAYLECKSIGLTPAQAKSLSPALCQLLQQQLNIQADRVYIEFSNCPAEFWGWNGSTFG